ncbi:ABC transporter ATP-binding protein [Lachnoclostridium sp.]|uniref:ABC transporter ATP-binding protein n=1 Tax=Lachnoclostridium sp. TaxID=2028282 RepID=UPI00289BFED3|nr:ABC transporter ATP-binding protein [Lachnoclostridium sp.]
MSQESNVTPKVPQRQRGPMGGGPMGGMGMGGEKAKNFKGSFRKLMSYLAPFRIQIFVVIVFAAISTVFTIVGPKILSKATDELTNGIMGKITGKGGEIDFSYIASIMLWLVFLYVVSAIFSYMQGHLMSGVSTNMAYNLRNAIMKKMNKLPFSYYNKTSHGEVLSRITNDVDTLNMTLNQSITQLITSVTSVIGVLIMMLSISWKLTIIAVLILPFSLLLVLGVVKKSQKYFQGQQKYLGRVNGHIEEMYGGHLVVKAFNGEEKSLEKFDQENEKLYESAWKSNFLSGLMMPIMNFVGNLGYVLICIVGASMAAGGTMTIGGIQAFIQYVRSFTQPISQIANISNQIQQMVAAAERVFEFLDENEESKDDVKVTMNDVDLKGDVTFEHVRFGYEDTDQIVIKDFSVKVKAGQKVAIVGPTGAGKTTLVKLLMRFHDINSGDIYVDGYNTKDFARSDLRTEFGMVLQDTWLYNGTIMDNIRYGKLDATDEEVIKAAKAAQVDHFVRTLPDGYQMVLNEEASNISQGQKQLLTIARAVLADSKILILDEATSSVDTRTEVLIQKAMDNLMKGRTSFIIAHRLSTIRNADIILCMKDGDIIEQGNHDELMKLDGFYANLYNSQFEKLPA